MTSVTLDLISKKELTEKWMIESVTKGRKGRKGRKGTAMMPWEAETFNHSL